jgi:protein ImuB
VALDTHDPALAGRAAPYLSAAASAAWERTEEGEPPSRPLTLFLPPQPIEVLAEVPDSPPLRFRWRRVLHHVALAEGPERIAPEWWRSAAPQEDVAPAPRDYYRVEDMKGHRFWIFREGLYEDGSAHPRWFIHGLFT